MARYKVKCTLSNNQITLQGLFWLVFIILTFGLASVYFPFHVAREVQNSLEINEVPEI